MIDIIPLRYENGEYLATLKITDQDYTVELGSLAKLIYEIKKQMYEQFVKENENNKGE